VDNKKQIIRTSKRLFSQDFLKVSILVFLILFCTGIVYYFTLIKGIHIVFTHLFYVPIIFAGFFWGRKSIWTAFFLGVCLIVLYILSDSSPAILIQNILCAAMLILINKDHIITHFNKACECLTGLSAEYMIGSNKQWMISYDEETATLADLILYGSSEDVITKYYNGNCRKSSLVQGAYEGEVFNSKLGENGKWLYISVAPITNTKGEVTGAIQTLLDLTDIKDKQAEETIRYQSCHDILTCLPNSILFNARLNMALTGVRRSNKMLGVMYIDLDRFKHINYSLGHDLGDELLLSVGQRLTGLVREVDTVARMGGDVFTVLLSEISQAEEVINIAQRITDVFKQPFMIRENEIYISMSIGISVYPTNGDDGETLVKNAEIAMFRAKDLGGDNYQFFTLDMDNNSSDRFKMTNDLRHALERQEIKVHYQPKVNIRTGRVTGMEALARWQHPDLGLISPMKFIPLAEETGLIIPISEWVLRTACAQTKTWQDAGFPFLNVAVNLSMLQFRQRDLVETVDKILKETGLEPQCLELEITETMAFKNSNYNIIVLHKLRKMGVKISLDDFGTGYSSISYLKYFPLDNLKIDQSFVNNIFVDDNNAAIVVSIIDLAHRLNLKVIAEGVESEEQLEFLKHQKCDEMQGYLFSKPLPGEEFEKILQEN